jgi:predicted metal-dependent peptidase
MSAASKVTAAVTSLVLEQPFFGSLALSLKRIADPTCGTAWTDGRSLGYDPAFIDSLSHDKVTALIAHEVMHCAMGHPFRRDARDFKNWNIACDMAINRELRDSGFTLPDGALYPNSGDEGKSSEWYYARIGENDTPDPNGNGRGQGPGTGTQQDPNGKGTPDPLGEVRDAPTGIDADGDAALTEQEWKQRAAEALNSAKMAGKLPGGLSRQVSNAIKPRLDVRSLLLRFFSERSTGDYSWTRPSPRFIHAGLYLPCLESKSLGEIAVFIDTSASMDQISLAYAAGIVQDTLDECDPAAVTLYFSDTQVAHVQRLERGDPLVWEPKGNGGTDFRPVLKAIEDEGTACCAICISDLDGPFPESCGIPVLWLSTDESAIAPFGETVPIPQ